MFSEIETNKSVKLFKRLFTVSGLTNAVFITALSITFYVLAFRWNTPILDGNGFRQTQTAISAFWMARNWNFLDYQTPVLGYPWSIPFELPVYELIVAALSRILPIDLDQTGRVVSLLFFLGCYWPIIRIFTRLGLSRDQSKLIFSLALLSPIYLFMNSTFLIESTALFFSVSFISAVISFADTPNIWRFVLMTSLAVLAATVKITTFVPFSIAAAAFTIYHIWTNRSTFLEKKSLFKYSSIAISVIISLIVLELWVVHSDNLKMENPLAHFITSKALFYWNFGTLKERLSSGLRHAIFDRTTEAVGSRLLFIIATTISLAINKRKYLTIQAILLAIYVSDFFIFTNLIYVQPYYSYENDLFLVAAFAIALIGVLELSVFRFALLLTMACTVFLVEFKSHYLPQIISAPYTQGFLTAKFIKQYTNTGQVVVGFGQDWSSVIPYYAQRKSVLIRDSDFNTSSLEQINQNVYHKRYDIGAVFVCGGWRPAGSGASVATIEKYNNWMKYLVAKYYRYNIPDGCTVFTQKKARGYPPKPFLVTSKVYISTQCKEDSVDSINDLSPAPRSVTAQGTLSVAGWLTVSTKEGIKVPHRTFVSLTSTNGDHLFCRTTKIGRPDVVAALKNPSVLLSGFSTACNIRKLSGHYMLGLAYEKSKHLKICSNNNIPITILGSN